nr:MAG TPA: Putative integrase [Caudoviricetes sp.]
MKIEYIDEQLEKYAYMKECLLKYSEIKANEALEVKIFKMYLNIESTTKIASWLNQNGYRLPSIKGQRKYRVTDISEILNNKEADVDEELKYIVQKLFKANKSGAKQKEWDKRWQGYRL